MESIKLYTEGAKDNNLFKYVIPFAFNYESIGNKKAVNKNGGSMDQFQAFVKGLCNDETGRWHPTNMKENNNELYEHIISLIDGELPSEADAKGQAIRHNQIACSLGFNPDKDESGTIYNPKKHKGNQSQVKITCKGLERGKYFSIKKVELMLFVTGIGFLVITNDTENLETLDEVIIASNQFKAIKHNELYEVEVIENEFLDDLDSFLWEHKEWAVQKADKTITCNNEEDMLEVKDYRNGPKGQCILSKEQLGIDPNNIKDIKVVTKKSKKKNDDNDVTRVDGVSINYFKVSEKEMHFKAFINFLMSDIKVITYFNQSISESLHKPMCNKANIFNAVIIRHDQQPEEEIRKAFFRLRKGYTSSYNPSQMEISETNEEVYNPLNNSYWGFSREAVSNLYFDSNTFMKNDYIKRIDNYFYLYIIALHQYYGLLYLAQQVSYLPIDLENCTKKEDFKKLSTIRNSCNFFYLKCIFDEVTHISHQAVYYERLIGTLGTNKMQCELNYEMERIYEIVERNKKDAEDRRINNFGLLVSLMALVSVLGDLIGLWGKIGEVNDRFAGYEMINGVISFFTFITVLMFIFWLKAYLDKRDN